MSEDDEVSRSLQSFLNRRVYTSLDAATIEAIADDDLEQAVQDYIFTLISDDFSDEEQVIRRLAPSFRAVYATLHVEGEVNNGGFNQYFWNSGGRLADVAVEGFVNIGAPEYADLMTRAIVAWRAEEPEITPYREVGSLEAFSESYGHSKLDVLDDEFFELQKVSSLSALRTAYIRKNARSFSAAAAPN